MSFPLGRLAPWGQGLNLIQTLIPSTWENTFGNESSIHICWNEFSALNSASLWSSCKGPHSLANTAIIAVYHNIDHLTACQALCHGTWSSHSILRTWWRWYFYHYYLWIILKALKLGDIKSMVLNWEWFPHPLNKGNNGPSEDTARGWGGKQVGYWHLKNRC